MAGFWHRTASRLEFLEQASPSFGIKSRTVVGAVGRPGRQAEPVTEKPGQGSRS
jgi:hypothetical protein